jgi:hypothetical protein
MEKEESTVSANTDLKISQKSLARHLLQAQKEEEDTQSKQKKKHAKQAS